MQKGLLFAFHYAMLISGSAGVGDSRAGTKQTEKGVTQNDAVPKTA